MRSTRAAFTLIEMLIVVLGLLLLMGIGIPAWNAFAKRAKINASRQLVMAFATAIARDPHLSVTCGVGAGTTLRNLYDFDGDGLLDGDPTSDPGFNATARLHATEVGYLGAVSTARIAVSRAQLDGFQRPLDAWKHPLHIGISVKAYGASHVGIWSAGPDGIDGNADDLRSW